jgi:amidase
MEGSFAYASAAELAALIREGKATATHIASEQIDHIKRHNKKLGSIAILMEEEAMRAAAELDAENARGSSRGPLHGVPMTVKEQFWIKGTKSTLNSSRYRNWTAPEDAEVVKRLKRAGAVILGKSNVAKDLIDTQIIGDIYPEGKNPYGLEHTPGGSSGGAAAALASGMVPLELGADLAGSIRLPANYCGVYGLKPSEGSISAHGNASMPIPLHMATAGPMARTPEDLELLWNAIRDLGAGTESKPGRKALGDFRVAWTDGWENYPASEETMKMMAAFKNALSAKGMNATKSRPAGDLHRRSLALYFRLMPKSLFYSAPWIVRKLAGADLMRGNPFAADLKAGFDFSERNYAAILETRKSISAEWEGFFSSYDILVCPAGYSGAPRRRPRRTPADYDGKMVSDFDDIFPFLSVFNASGHPAMSIPMGIGPNGLPIGVQIVAAMGREQCLLDFAKQAASIGSFTRPTDY